MSDERSIFEKLISHYLCIIYQLKTLNFNYNLCISLLIFLLRNFNVFRILYSKYIICILAIAADYNTNIRFSYPIEYTYFFWRLYVGYRVNE